LAFQYSCWEIKGGFPLWNFIGKAGYWRQTFGWRHQKGFGPFFRLGGIFLGNWIGKEKERVWVEIWTRLIGPNRCWLNWKGVFSRGVRKKEKTEGFSTNWALGSKPLNWAISLDETRNFLGWDLDALGLLVG